MSDAEPSSFVIRPLVHGDLDSLLVLYRHLISDDLDLPGAVAQERFAAILTQPGMTVFGGFSDDVLAASCTLAVIPNLTRGGASYALIENVVTHADHRRRGYGRAIIDTTVAAAFEQGCYKVMLLTASRNSGTLDFYRSCGVETSKTGLEIRRPSA